MGNTSNLFEEFKAIGKQAWLDKIEKDLKGKPLDALNWRIDDELSLNPFYTSEDLESIPNIELIKESSDWEIGEKYVCRKENFAEVNSMALEGLQNGVQSLFLDFEDTPDAEGFSQLLNNIELTFISHHFGAPTVESAPVILNHFLNLAKTQGKKLEGLKFSLSVPTVNNENHFDQLKKLLTEHPSARLGVSDAWEKTNDVNASQQIAILLKQGNQWLTDASFSGENIFFKVYIGMDYFLEIAKLRAFRWLWPKLQKAVGRPQEFPPFIEVHLNPDIQTEETYTNMIRSTTQAMAAAIGGADRIFIPPANSSVEAPNSFTRRIARNVQHILKMESHFDKVNDPAAGSYHLDTLTYKLAEKAWEHFRKM